MAEFIFEDWGLIDYQEALEKQQNLFSEALERKQSGRKVQNRIIFCEHPHVLTLGKNANRQNVLFSDKLLSEKGISLVRTERGGDVTYHGPGQLVVYPILDLESLGLGLKQYIETIEDIVIQLLKEEYEIRAERMPGATGVWLDTENPALVRKICAIGVKSSRYVTMHGLALNVNTDLSRFSLINPCGFTDKGVTSVARELNAPQDLAQCRNAFRKYFQQIIRSANAGGGLNGAKARKHEGAK